MRLFAASAALCLLASCQSMPTTSQYEDQAYTSIGGYGKAPISCQSHISKAWVRVDRNADGSCPRNAWVGREALWVGQGSCRIEDAKEIIRIDSFCVTKQ